MALDWLPILPDAVRPHRRSHFGESVFMAPWSAQAFPVVDVLATKDFLPTYPSKGPHTRTMRDTEVMTAPLFYPAAAPVSWLPTTPDRAVRHQPPKILHQSYFDPTFGEGAQVAARMAWSPQLPQVLPHHRRYPTGAAWTVDPSIPAGTQRCVEFIVLTVSTPTLSGEAFTTPDLLAGALTTATLINEELC